MKNKALLIGLLAVFAVGLIVTIGASAWAVLNEYTENPHWN